MVQEHNALKIIDNFYTWLLCALQADYVILTELGHDELSNEYLTLEKTLMSDKEAAKFNNKINNLM
jgi:hypothetical protein